MSLRTFAFLGLIISVSGFREAAVRETADQQRDRELTEQYRRACPQYARHAAIPHGPLSKGSMALPYQRPVSLCRTFKSDAVEKVIDDVTSRMTDLDLARLFENAFPNTLDTTVSWHTDGSQPIEPSNQQLFNQYSMAGSWDGPQSFIVTGDITAEWLRDSTNQLQQYQSLALTDSKLSDLILGAINTQAEFVIQSPYCNAFQPPRPSGLEPTENGQRDYVHPAYEPEVVFECKYELDSLAHFLKLGNEFYEHTKSTKFLTKRWYHALDTVLKVLTQQSKPTFNITTGSYDGNEYTFSRTTNVGTETLALAGLGNPANAETDLIRSAFRPSDDATILPFFIPANAMMSVELGRTAKMLMDNGKSALAKVLQTRSGSIQKGIMKHAIVTHATFGDVFAFEIDGYGSSILMDDANLPSLLSLPLLGFVDVDNKVYQNTRRMILSQKGNPYYLNGTAFSGIGGPHIGLQYAWPMSRLVQAMTSNDDDEILECLNAVKRTCLLGLIHESINVEMEEDYTR
jgi:meiotically up-regulated gene 157 (Mug157) protein